VDEEGVVIVEPSFLNFMNPLQSLNQ
jgi:hypothetical protein